jgi:hypothetical protein
MQAVIKPLLLSLVWLGLSSTVSLASYTMPPTLGGHTAPNATGGAVISSVPRTKPNGFRWKPALRQSLKFLVFEHGYRLLQQKTRMELGGPFFKDWGTSVHNIHGWGDGDPIIANYVAHPMQGAVAGYIQIQNDPGGQGQEFGRSKRYWISRLKALAWAAGYSTNFEMGPLSEAAIGNVGLIKGTSSLVDFVVTPVGGLGMMVLEDVLNRFVLKKLEARTTSQWKLGLYRILFNPSRSFAGFFAGRLPWDQRPHSSSAAMARSPKPFPHDSKSRPKKVDGWNQLAWPGEFLAACSIGTQSCRSQHFTDVDASQAEETPEFDIVVFPKVHLNSDPNKHRS